MGTCDGRHNFVFLACGVHEFWISHTCDLNKEEMTQKYNTAAIFGVQISFVDKFYGLVI